ncbi:MAG: BLUF domain-containing protein [Cyanobacteriota bacterium]
MDQLSQAQSPLLTPKFMSLYRLIYSSQASADLTPEDLEAIQEAAQRHNQGSGITGLLCYGNHTFLQVLEGDCQEVSKTYHRIIDDKRHHSPLLIECVPVSNRFFEVWSMQSICLDDPVPDQLKHLVLKFSGSQSLKPEQMTPEQCLTFLKEVAYIYQLSDNFLVDL